MKKYIILHICLFISTIGFSQVSENKSFYFPNGKVSSEGTMVDGKPDGYWKTYYESGKIKSEGNRKNFELDSLWKFYDEAGKLSTELTYKKGKKNGIKNIYSKDGNLVTTESYIEDVKEGFTLNYKDNALLRKTPFVKGKEEGNGYEYNKEGLITSLFIYKNGYLVKEERINRTDKIGLKQGVWKTFYENGTVKTEQRYKDDKLDGYYKEFAMNGDLIKTIKYVNGEIEKNTPELVKLETKNTYYENGRIKSSGTFKEGIAEGYTRIYNEEGKIVNAQLYKDGYLMGEGVYDERGFQQGPWKEFYYDGKLKAQGVYEDGKRVGEWVYYHQNGQIEQKGKYLKGGKPDGEWKWFFADGKPLRVENYRKGIREGQMIEYNDQGVIIAQGEYLDGEPDGSWFTIEGDIKDEGSYKNGLKDGHWKGTYISSGKTAYESFYIDGNFHNDFICWFDNGKVREEGKYVVGKKEGLWKKYLEDGSLFYSAVYKDGIEVKIDGLKVTVNE